MGVTVHYRGSIADLARVEDLEDRVLDLALELGANAQIWRSFCPDNPNRIMRGVILDLYPGQESTSLLLSPEGWLVNLVEIRDAETGELQEPPWCSVKTQFGPIEGHVALVELLAALKKEFIPNLQVRDEGNYWDGRDAQALRATFGRIQSTIDGLADGLRRHALSAEAAESPEIVMNRIERVAQIVHQTLARPAEHAPVRFEQDATDPDIVCDGTEEQWDAQFKENRRKQERIQRAIEERLGRGEDSEGAFEGALRDEGIIDLPDEPSGADDDQDFDSDSELEMEEDSPWKDSLPELVRDEQAEDEELATADSEPFGGKDRHPLLERAMDFMMQVHDLFEKDKHVRSSHADVLQRGAGELMGGLAQALGSGDSDVHSGWDLVQLKRALRGAAFAQGALFPLHSEGVMHDTTLGELRNTVQSIESEVFAELRRLRDARDDS
jgi:hypothetical protein